MPIKVLSEVGVRQPLQEARELVESSYSLRANVLRDLLKRCASVKTVRLCLPLARELSAFEDIIAGEDRCFAHRPPLGDRKRRAPAIGMLPLHPYG